MQVTFVHKPRIGINSDKFMSEMANDENLDMEFKELLSIQEKLRENKVMKSEIIELKSKLKKVTIENEELHQKVLMLTDKIDLQKKELLTERKSLRNYILKYSQLCEAYNELKPQNAIESQETIIPDLQDRFEPETTSENSAETELSNEQEIKVEIDKSQNDDENVLLEAEEFSESPGYKDNLDMENQETQKNL